MTRTGVRRFVRAVMDRPLAIARRSPHLTLRGADALAPVMFWRRSSAADLRSLLGDVSPVTARALRARMLRNLVRGNILAAWLRGGGRTSVRALLLGKRLPALPAPPLILGTFHVGPVIAVGAALELQTPPLFVVHSNESAPVAGAAAQQRRAEVFIDSLQVLKRGGAVLMALDPQLPAFIAAPFFGGTLRLARGSFALARLTGAAIVPVVARWVGTKIEIVVGDALQGDGPDLESSLAASAARWLEAYLRAHPEEISQAVLDLMER